MTKETIKRLSMTESQYLGLHELLLSLYRAEKDEDRMKLYKSLLDCYTGVLPSQPVAVKKPAAVKQSETVKQPATEKQVAGQAENTAGKFPEIHNSRKSEEGKSDVGIS